MSRADTDMGENTSEQVFVLGRQIIDRDGLLEADQIRKAGGDLPDRQNKIDDPGRDRVARHRRMFSFGGILDENNAAALFDGAHAERSVRAGSGFKMTAKPSPRRSDNERKNKTIADRRPRGWSNGTAESS